ncbi:unnamed protein product [Amoebophrya sp. A25]|nr:unnamed protein product [Amoebophrya sp. A25]|eukprot:GSA25T00021476001.1
MSSFQFQPVLAKDIYRRRMENITNDVQFSNEFEAEHGRGVAGPCTVEHVKRFRMTRHKVNEPRDETWVTWFGHIFECTMRPGLVQDYIKQGIFKKDDKCHYVRTGKCFVGVEDEGEIEIIAGGHRCTMLKEKLVEHGDAWVAELLIKMNASILILSDRAMAPANRDALLLYKDLDNEEVDGLPPQIPDIVDCLPGLLVNYAKNPDGASNEHEYVVKHKYKTMQSTRFKWLKEFALVRSLFQKGSLTRVKARKYGSGTDVASVMRQQCGSWDMVPQENRLEEGVALVLTLKGNKKINMNGNRGDYVETLKLYYANTEKLKGMDEIAEDVKLKVFDEVSGKIVDMLEAREQKRQAEKKSGNTRIVADSFKTNPADYGLTLPPGVKSFVAGSPGMKVSEQAQKDDKYLALWRRVEDMLHDGGWELAEGIYQFAKRTDDSEQMDFISDEIPAGCLVQLAGTNPHQNEDLAMGRVLRAVEAPQAWLTALPGALDKNQVKTLCERTLRRRLLVKLGKDMSAVLRAGRSSSKIKAFDAVKDEDAKAVIKGNDKNKKSNATTSKSKTSKASSASSSAAPKAKSRSMKTSSAASASSSASSSGAASPVLPSFEFDADADMADANGEAEGAGVVINTSARNSCASSTSAAENNKKDSLESYLNDSTISTFEMINAQENELAKSVKKNLEWLSKPADYSKEDIMKMSFAGVAKDWTPLFKQVWHREAECPFKFATDALIVNENSIPNNRTMLRSGMTATSQTKLKYGDMASGVLLRGNYECGDKREVLSVRFRAQLKPSTVQAVAGASNVKNKKGDAHASGGIDMNNEMAERLYEIYEEEWALRHISLTLTVVDTTEARISLLVPIRKRDENDETNVEEAAPKKPSVRGALE